MGTGRTSRLPASGAAVVRGTAARLGDVAIAAVAGIGAVEAAAAGRSVWVVAVTVAWYLPLLLLRRRAPLGAAVATGFAVVATTLVAAEGIAQIGAPALATGTSLLLASAATACDSAHRRRDLVVLAVLVVTTSAAALARSPHPLEELGLLVALVGLCVAAGWLLPRRIADADRARRLAVEAEHGFDAAVRDVIAAERATVARELHDVVAHGVTIMILQAAAARTLVPTDPRAAREAIVRVSAAGATAVGDLGRLCTALGGTHDPHHPQPRLADLPALLEEFREAGLTVRADLPPAEDQTGETGLDVTVHRIVQEALTNVLRHAGPTEVQVTVALAADHVSVEVIDTGPCSAGSSDRPARRVDAIGAGHGLLGMQERAALYGGVLTAAPVDGGFAVTATLPRRVPA